MNQRGFEKQDRDAAAALRRDNPAQFECVTVNGIEYYAEPGETARAAIKRVRGGGGTMSPRGHLAVLRERAKHPFWVQHERKNLRVRVSEPITNERAARRVFDEARRVKGTTMVMLFQHAIDKTIILDQFTGVSPRRQQPPPRRDMQIRDELR